MRGAVICRRCGRTTSSCRCTGARPFAVKIFLGKDPETGRERQKWIGGFRSEREAKAHLLAVAANPAYGSGLGPYGSMRLRLGDYLREWLQSTKQTLSEHEYRTRLSRLQKHILPRLAHVQLARLAPATLQRLFSVDLANLNPTTAHKVFKDLRQALERAVQLGVITSNPCRAVESPRPREYRPTLWTVEEFGRFLAACAGAGPKGLLFVTAFAAGARQGELLAAQWRHIDVDHEGILWVLQDLERPAGGGFRFGDVKSKHGRRAVRLPRPLVAALRAERARQREERLRCGLCPEGADCRAPRCQSWHALDLIFCQPNGKPLHGHNLTQRDLKALCARVGVPAIRFHDFRHLHNTTLMREKISARVVQERAGHHSAAFTLDRYSWVTPDLQEGAAEVLERTLAAATGMLPDPAVPASRAAKRGTAKTRG
jgi:integrase